MIGVSPCDARNPLITTQTSGAQKQQEGIGFYELKETLAYVAEERGRRDYLNIYRLRVHWDPFCLLYAWFPDFLLGITRRKNSSSYLGFNLEACNLIPLLSPSLCAHSNGWGGCEGNATPVLLQFMSLGCLPSS